MRNAQLPESFVTDGTREAVQLEEVCASDNIHIQVSTGVAAAQAYAVLGHVMSLVGGLCSMCCSLLLPSLFYLVLHKDDLTLLRKCGTVAVLATGLALLLLIVTQNFSALAAPHSTSTGRSCLWSMQLAHKWEHHAT